MKQRTNIAGMTFLDNIDEVALGLFGNDSGQSLETHLDDYRTDLEKSFETDTPLVPPTYALLKVTNRCNSRCGYCSHGQGKPVYYEPATKELIWVIQQMAELGVKSINFSGGEATLRPDLPKLVAIAKQLGLVPILLTNGLLLNKQRAALVKAGIDYIIISLDSLSTDIYQLQRGVPLQGALNGLETALQMRQEDNPNLVIGVTTVITRRNLTQLPELLEWLTERQISLQITPYHHFDPTVPDYLSPQNEEQFCAVIERLIEMRDNGYPLSNSLGYLRGMSEYIFRNRLPDNYRCYAAYTGVFVDADLNLRPCWSWSIPIVANLQTDILVEAWHSDAFQKGRERVRKLDCSKCWMLCTAEFSQRFLEKNGDDE